jgi:hypothetical protein
MAWNIPVDRRITPAIISTKRIERSLFFEKTQVVGGAEGVLCVVMLKRLLGISDDDNWQNYSVESLLVRGKEMLKMCPEKPYACGCYGQ